MAICLTATNRDDGSEITYTGKDIDIQIARAAKHCATSPERIHNALYSGGLWLTSFLILKLRGVDVFQFTERTHNDRDI